MMTPQFQRAVEFTLKHEGRYSNHPADQGGKTRFGITEATASRAGLDFKIIKLKDAKVIYKVMYWDKVQASKLNPDLAVVVFDQAVNCGVRSASRRLQRAYNVGLQGRERLKVDGVVGPKTIKAVNSEWLFVLHHFIVMTYNFYGDLVARKPHQAVFLRGWLKRVNSYLAFLSW